MAGHEAGARYSRVAIALHWAIAVLIILNLVIGFFMEGLEGPIRRFTINLHISAGMTVLALTVVRVIWRLIHKPPPHPEDMKPWERHSASLAHFGLYVAMVAMPLTGWALISANPPIGSPGAAAVAEARAKASPDAPKRQARTSQRTIWGFIPFPSIATFERIGEQPEGVELQKQLHDDFVDWHIVGAYLTILLLLLHVAGALKHQFMDKHPEFARMGIGRRRKTNPSDA